MKTDNSARFQWILHRK